MTRGETIIESHGRWDWALVVVEGGEGDTVIEARKPIPHDGVRVFSTADRPDKPRGRSRHRLAVRQVVHQYVRRSPTERTVDELLREIMAAREADEESGDAVDTIPEPFDTLPMIDDPTPEERENATFAFPPWAVPDEGPIPDYAFQHTVEHDLVVPEWALVATRYRLSAVDPEDLDRWRVEEVLMEDAAIHERFVTPDGRDAVDVLLAELRGGDGDDE